MPPTRSPRRSSTPSNDCESSSVNLHSSRPWPRPATRSERCDANKVPSPRNINSRARHSTDGAHPSDSSLRDPLRSLWRCAPRDRAGRAAAPLAPKLPRPYGADCHRGTETDGALSSRHLHWSGLQEFLLVCGIALAVMALLSLGLGWLLVGRLLRPLRTMTRPPAESLNTTLTSASISEGPRRAHGPRRHHRRTPRPARNGFQRPATVRRQRLPRAANPSHSGKDRA